MKNDELNREKPITLLIRISGYSSILFVTLILLFLVREGLPTIGETPASSLFGSRWYPIENLYGIWPLLGGSLIVTIGAMLIALPFGIGTAVFISEVAPPGSTIS
jgi:phosphate transport system permease protein